LARSAAAKDVPKARKKVKNIDFQYLQIATIYLQILQISRMSRYFLSSKFQYFRDIDRNILQYIDQYIGQSGVNISAILEYIDNILINISNNIGKY